VQVTTVDNLLLKCFIYIFGGLDDCESEAVRQIEAQVHRAFGAFSSGVHMIDAAQASSEQVG
jgi:cbb3-type cytochrome oxidase cytochrome c subunit